MAKRTKLSLHPLKFDDAVFDLLKVKPEPKDKPKRKVHKVRRLYREALRMAVKTSLKLLNTNFTM